MKRITNLLFRVLVAWQFSTVGIANPNVAEPGAIERRSQDESDAYKAENLLVAPYAYGRLPLPTDDYAESAHHSALIEAAGEYCRDKGLDFWVALPRIAAVHSVIFCGPLPSKPHEDEQRWAILYRNIDSGNNQPLDVRLLLLHPKGHAPKLSTQQQKDDYVPTVRSISPKGFDTGTSIAWWEGEGSDIAVVVLRQSRPSAGYPWYTQWISKYRVRADGFKRLWQKSVEQHEVNFVSVYEMSRFSYRGSRPRIILGEPKEK